VLSTTNLLPRISVIITSHGEGDLLTEAVHSIREEEPIELVIVDDASPDAATQEILEMLEREGVRVLRQETNCGVARARMTGFAATSAPLVYPLDADDHALPGVLARMADVLERSPEAAVCAGDVVEFGEHLLLRETPAQLDPYRVAYTNEYPITALFRRSAIEAAGGWRRLGDHHGYDDWSLWMGLAERGERLVHLGGPGYRRRMHGRRLNREARMHHRQLYAAMRSAHPDLFTHLREHRRRSDLHALRKYLYPVLFGARAEVPFEGLLKPLFDRVGFWTRTRPGARPGLFFLSFLVLDQLGVT
jgi:glycosyltransferase involved in cell wall biosynthesis